MFINELIGYKNNPIYKATKDAFVRSNNTYDNIDDFKQKLISLGYSAYIIGIGTKALVFKKPNSGYVIKVFHRDPNYLKYLEYVYKH
jgi:hypothetical protein